MNAAEAIATNRWVRRPAGRSWRSRSKPIVAPSAPASKMRRTSSSVLGMGVMLIRRTRRSQSTSQGVALLTCARSAAAGDGLAHEQVLERLAFGLDLEHRGPA